MIYSGTSGTTPIIAGAKSCVIRKHSEYIEKASSTSSTAKEYIAGRTGWEVSLDHLITSDAPFEGILEVGQTYTLRMVIGTTTKQGTAICTESDLKGPVGGLASGSVKFQGSGELT